MARVSAGLLMYRIQDGKLQVLLAHPGGPLFKNKDDDTWTIPKGELDPGEDMLEAAKRPIFRIDTDQAKGREDRSRLGIQWRLRSNQHCQQHVHDGMASKVRTTDGVSRNRPSRFL